MYFDYITQQLRDEVPNQIDRFNIPHAFSTWENYCIVVHDRFLRDRSERIIGELHGFLSVEEPLAYAVQCYPNPFSDEIRLGIESEGLGATEIAIYDMLGRKVFAQPCCLNGGYNELVLHPQIATGVYVLKLGVLTMKIVKR